MCRSAILFLSYLLIEIIHRSKYDIYLSNFIRFHLKYIVDGEYYQTIVVQPKSIQAPVGATIVLDCTVFNQYGEVAW